MKRVSCTVSARQSTSVHAKTASQTISGAERRNAFRSPPLASIA
jgi:hypothetical protein